MSRSTRDLHQGLDAHTRRTGLPYLNPDEPTVQLDLFGSARAIAWQERKAAFLFASAGCWSELPHLYARYGSTTTAALISALKQLESASSVLVGDSGMQVTALTFDVLMTPGSHAVLMRQVYNKTRSYLSWLAERVGGRVTIVDDGDHEALANAITPDTRFVFAETFTNPLVRAQDIDRLRQIVAGQRHAGRSPKLVIDSTIATPWAFKIPLLEQGVDIVLGSGTKSLGGTDRDLWGYIATRDTQFANSVMDLMAMRGGILDWRRAAAILPGLVVADERHAQRSATATRIAAFLSTHPKVSEVFHPSLHSHPDAKAIAQQYVRHGSMVSFRVADADEDHTRHVADVLATSTIVRYALSFDGLVTKVNHHKTVSEYFTPAPELKRNGFDRLIRLAVGLEAADDLIAVLNWTLHHADHITAAQVEEWQTARMASLRLVEKPGLR